MSWNSWIFSSLESIKGKMGFSITRSARRGFASILEANHMRFLIFLSGFRRNLCI